MASLYLANVNDDAQEVIGTRSLQFHILSTATAASTVGVGKHVELKRELNGVINLGRSPVMFSLFELESLGDTCQ
jgi:hypothetical protein